MREQTVQERIQAQLGSGYDVQSSNGGYTAKAAPVKYLRKKDSRTKVIRRGQQYQYSTYSPHELLISSEGTVQKETKRGTYKVDASGKIKEWGVYDSEITDYEKQTRFTFGKRDMRSGRQSIRTTSEQVAGVYKEKRIIHQDSKEYEMSKRTEEQARLIREKGFTVRQTEEYAVAGMSKGQRTQYYKLKAQQRTAQFSLEAKAQKIARQETEKFRSELSQESQIYAMDIVAELKAQRKAREIWVKTTPPPKTTGPTISGFFPPTPASPTTRTDMGDKMFLIGGKLPPGELVVPEKPKGIIARYHRASDILSLKQSRARQKGAIGTSVAYGAAEFAIGVPAGAYQLAKGVITQPHEVVGAMFNPESYRQAGIQLRERPARFAGETVGAVALSWGVGKGVQAVRTQLAKPKITGESAVPGSRIKKTEFQARFPKEGKGVDIVTTKELKFLKQKTGKGQIESTVFSAKKVIDKKGRTIETPSITKIRDEIAGKPSKIGTIYGEQVGKPIKVAPDIETTLVKPQVFARSKWMPGDVRPVVVRHGKVYVPDWTGGTLRPYRAGEFTLETVYPGGGLTASQKAAVGHQTLSYTKTAQTPYGPFTITKKPGPGVQATLYPKEIIIVKKPGTPSAQPSIKPLETSIKTTKPPSGTIVDSGPGSQIVVAKVKPVKFATAGEVLHGTIKVYPKYQVTPGKTAPPMTKLPETADLVPKSQYAGKFALAGGLAQFPKQEPVSILQEPSQITAPIMDIAPRVDARVRTEPIVSIVPDTLAASKAEAKAKAISIVEPIVVLEPVTRTRTQTETRMETRLQTDLLTEQITRVAPKTVPAGPFDLVPLKPPPPVLLLPKPREKEIKRKKGKYQVEVREKGIFKKVKVAETVEEAFRFGEKRVRSTASASLRVKPVSGGRAVSGFGRSLLPKKIFRESKKEPGVFIQKKQFRISSPGEKKEITHKGLMALKIKSIFRR